VSGNPVLTRLNKAEARTATFRPAPTSTGNPELEQIYNQPAYGGPTPPVNSGPGGWGRGRGGGGGGGAGAPTRYMTLDDVVVRTGAMLAVLFATGAITWVLNPTRSTYTGLIVIGAMGGLGLGLYMAFTMKANAVTALLYAGFEGVLLGAVSKAFESRYPGIVIQALTGTVMVAVAVLIVYKVGAIRVTPKFTRIVFAATLGAFGLMLVNLVAYLFHPGGLGLRSGGGLAIVFSVICIGLAAMNLVIDFDMVEQGIRRGADEKFAWYASFGILVTLVWLYIEILRLLGYIRNN
jgi:uncharacterized YccA/Bax inhibitor family protein